ncbi:NINE protein [bacterium 3DAC]|nr:NINE protein [bacterium 3DAC]
MADVVQTQEFPCKKSRFVVFLLWFFFGGFGGHDFYVGRTWAGVLKIILAIIGIITSGILIGFIFIAIDIIWVLIDLFVVVLAGDLCKWQKEKQTVIVVQQNQNDSSNSQ